MAPTTVVDLFIISCGHLYLTDTLHV
jgi:hypothetical protein